ncbi:MAG: hypothetical protein ABI609_11625 [Acidobacteriota bacterium]
MRPFAKAALALGLGVTLACSHASTPAGDQGTTRQVREGVFERRLDVTATVRAERGESLTVPQTPAWQLSVRWLIEDGTPVAAGDRLAEFDNGQLAGDLDQKRTAAEEAEAALRQARAESAGKLDEAEWNVAKTRDELAKAQSQADVPAEVLPARAYDDRQLALQSTRAEAAKAEAALLRAKAETKESIGAAELARQQKVRERDDTETHLTALVLRAPRAGIALVQDIPWEGRRIQNGDALVPGLTVVAMPDLDSLFVVGSLYDVDQGAMHAGDPAQCIADTYPAEPFPCRVRDVAAVAHELSPQTTRRAFRVALDFTDPVAARARLRPGMSIRAEVIVEHRDHARLVPRQLLSLDGRTTRLRLPSGAFEVVRLGPCNAGECVLLEGSGAAGGAP